MVKKDDYDLEYYEDCETAAAVGFYTGYTPSYVKQQVAWDRSRSWRKGRRFTYRSTSKHRRLWDVVRNSALHLGKPFVESAVIVAFSCVVCSFFAMICFRCSLRAALGKHWRRCLRQVGRVGLVTLFLYRCALGDTLAFCVCTLLALGIHCADIQRCRALTLLLCVLQTQHSGAHTRCLVCAVAVMAPLFPPKQVAASEPDVGGTTEVREGTRRQLDELTSWLEIHRWETQTRQSNDAAERRVAQVLAGLEVREHRPFSPDRRPSHRQLNSAEVEELHRIYVRMHQATAGSSPSAPPPLQANEPKRRRLVGKQGHLVGAAAGDGCAASVHATSMEDSVNALTGPPQPPTTQKGRTTLVPPGDPDYFEEQQDAWCGMHALNNFLGGPYVNKDQCRRAARHIVRSLATLGFNESSTTHLHPDSGWLSIDLINVLGVGALGLQVEESAEAWETFRTSVDSAALLNWNGSLLDLVQN